MLNSYPRMFIDFRKGARKRNIDVEREHWSVPPIHTMTRSRTHIRGMCCDWGSNPQPLGIWDNTPTNWATQSGLEKLFYLFVLVGGEHREKRRERNNHVGKIDWLTSICTLTGCGTCNPSMYSDWELNLRPFALWDTPDQLCHTSQGWTNYVKWTF